MPHNIKHTLKTLWTKSRRIERIGYTVSAILFTSGLAHILVYAIDGGDWTGPVSWRKAITFGLSFGIVLATITWTSTHINMNNPTRNIILAIFTTTCVVETTAITTQTWRHLPSHFNTEDPLSATIGGIALAGGGGTLIATLIALTLLSLRRSPQTPPSMRLAVRAGYLILMTSMAAGAVMIATGAALTHTDSFAAAYQHGGWLKPTHAATMHAITVLPVIAGYLSTRDHTEKHRTRIVAIATSAYILAAAITLTINLVTAA